MTERLPVDPLDTLEIEIELEPPVGEARVLLVMLHGLGMDPAVLRPFLRSLALPAWGLVPEENLVGRAFFVWMHWDWKIRGFVSWDRIGMKLG